MEGIGASQVHLSKQMYLTLEYAGPFFIDPQLRLGVRAQYAR